MFHFKGGSSGREDERGLSKRPRLQPGRRTNLEQELGERVQQIGQRQYEFLQPLSAPLLEQAKELTGKRQREEPHDQPHPDDRVRKRMFLDQDLAERERGEKVDAIGANARMQPEEEEADGDPEREQRIRRVLGRLDAMLSLHLSTSAQREPEAKRASERHHAELGERVMELLAALPGAHVAPAQALENKRALAEQLARGVNDQLEQPVAFAAAFDGPVAHGETAQALLIQLSIAPNDWYGRLVLTAVYDPQAQQVVWFWRVAVRETGHAPLGGGYEQPLPQRPPQGNGRGVDEPMPIQGLPNRRNDCFLNACLQLLAGSYEGRLWGGDEDAAGRAELEALLRQINDPSVEIARHAVQDLRALLWGAHLVESPDGQEDAEELVGKLLDAYLGHGNGIRAIRRLRIQTSEPQVEGDEPPNDPLDYTNGDTNSVEQETQNVLRIPLNAGYHDLGGYLRGMLSGGAEDFAHGADWGRNQQGEVVSITRRTTTYDLLALPPVLTFQIQRSIGFGAKDASAFHMPELFTLVESGDGHPVARRFRLRSVVYHSGQSARGGHYWAHRRDEQAGWMKADDRSVQPDRRSGGVPVQGELEHDIDHGFLYAYERIDDALDQPLQLPEGGVDTTALDPAQLQEPARRGPQRDPEAPKRTPIPDEKRGPKQIVQCGNMTGDMFIICAALRLDPSLSVRVIWDRGYYLRVHEALAKELNIDVLSLFNRGKPPEKQAQSLEAVVQILGARMEQNATRIAAFYRSAGIAESRIATAESDPDKFPLGSYDDEYKVIKEAVLPKDGGKGDESLAVPGYATSTVQREFKRDRVAAEDTVRGMFDGIPVERRRVIDEFRQRTVGASRVVLLWSRGSSRSPGGGNTGLDTDPNVLEQLVRLMTGNRPQNGEAMETPPFMGRTPWIIGDPVPDASPGLAQYLNGHDLTLYWNRVQPALTELEQMYFLDQLRAHNAACAIAMISGILELPALLGMPTAYFELSFMRKKGKRWEKMAGQHKQLPNTGPVPQLNQVELSADQEYSANLREVQKALAHWLDRPRGDGLSASPQETMQVIQAVAGLGQRRGPMQVQPFTFDPDRMAPEVRQLGLDHLKDVGVRVAKLARYAPPEFSFEERRWLDLQFAQARQNFALSADELDSLGMLIRAWQNAELQVQERSVTVARLGSDPDRLVELLRGLAPQADIRHNGASITINGELTMPIGEIEDRIRRDPKWLGKQLRVDRARTLHADRALVVSTGAGAATELGRKFPGVDEHALAMLREALGDRAFSGLVSDLAETPQALGDLLPVVDYRQLARAATIVGPDAVAGMMVECRASPGRFVTFIAGALARQDEIENGAGEEFDDGGLDGAKVVDSSLAQSMHRASLSGDARELSLRPRQPQERSQVINFQTRMQQGEQIRGSALGYGRGNGRRMRVSTELDIGWQTGASVPLFALPVDADDRKGAEYTKLLETLAGLRIRNAGRAQLAELADVFMAAGKTKSTPQFHTGHVGILDALGEHAGYPMDKRQPKESYAKFFGARNGGEGQLGAQSFVCEVGGARVEIVPVEAVKLGKTAPSTSTMALARTVHGTGPTRLHDGTEVECTLRSTGDWETKPALVEGTFAGYTVEGLYRVRTEHGIETVDPGEYDVQVTEVGEPRTYEGKTILEVEEMFPKVRGTLAKKLRGIAERTVAAEVDGIEHYKVGDYLKIIEDAGFDAFIVGGAIRDLVSGAKDPADIDIATTMPAVDALTGFESNRLADRQGAEGMPHARTIPQHGLTQVEHQVETGLDVVSLHSAEHGVHPMDLETDVANRDFTINALFYDPRSERVLDPTGFGLVDLQNNVMRWTCAIDGDDAIVEKLRHDSYQIGRWIKFRIKGMVPAGPNDVAILNAVFAEHVNRGLTAEEKARILDGIGKPLETALAKADEMGVRRDLLEALGRVQY